MRLHFVCYYTFFWWYFSFRSSVCSTSLVPFLGATDWCSSCEHAVLSECRLKWNFHVRRSVHTYQIQVSWKTMLAAVTTATATKCKTLNFTHTKRIETKWMTALILRFLSIKRKRFVYSNMIWQLVYRRVKIKQQIFWSNEGRTHQSALTLCSFLLFIHDVHALHRDVSPLRTNKDFNYFFRRHKMITIFFLFTKISFGFDTVCELIVNLGTGVENCSRLNWCAEK